jgi:predicted dehydrogenase
MINIGVIGTSWITADFIKSCSFVPKLKVNAIYSRNIYTAQKFGAKNNIQNYFDDLEKMAQSDLIDCVYIASPNSLHFEQSKLFLLNKKHVLCEKLFALIQMSLKN